MSVRLSKTKKLKTNNKWKVLSFIRTTGSVFVPFDRKENLADTKRRSFDSVSVISYISMSNPLWTHLQEGMKKPVLWGPYSQIPHLQWVHRGMEGERKVRWSDGEGGDDWRTHQMWRGLKDTHTHTLSSSNKEKNLRKQKSEGGGYRAAALGQQEWRTEDSG